MKNRTNTRLLVAFLHSLAVYLFLVLACLEIIDLNIPLDWYTFRAFSAYFTIAFPVLPLSCLQLLLCRTVRRRWLRLLPLILAGGLLLLCGVGSRLATGWDSLGWWIPLIFSIAPVIGCILALSFHHLRQLYKRGDIRG